MAVDYSGTNIEIKFFQVSASQTEKSSLYTGGM